MSIAISRLRCRTGTLAAGALAVVGAAIATLSTATALPAAAASAGGCPSDGVPAPGSTINGTLEIDGDCTISNVTVNGNIVVDRGAGLGLENSTVNGSVTISPKAELDVNQALHGGPPSGAGTITGTLALSDPADVDIFGETIQHGLSVDKIEPRSGPGICGSTISGGVTVHNVHVQGAFNVGDPTDPPAFYGQPCPGNTITGGLSFNNVDPGVIEGNSINGGVTLINSTTELNGNSISGPMTCADNTAITAGEPPDPASNTCS